MQWIETPEMQPAGFGVEYRIVHAVVDTLGHARVASNPEANAVPGRNGSATPTGLRAERAGLPAVPLARSHPLGESHKEIQSSGISPAPWTVQSWSTLMTPWSARGAKRSL